MTAGNKLCTSYLQLSNSTQKYLSLKDDIYIYIYINPPDSPISNGTVRIATSKKILLIFFSLYSLGKEDNLYLKEGSPTMEKMHQITLFFTYPLSFQLKETGKASQRRDACISKLKRP